MDPGVFAPDSGTRLHVIDFADDPWSLNAAAIYAHLTGEPSLAGFTSINGPDHEAVHDYTITDPDVVRAAVKLPRSEG